MILTYVFVFNFVFEIWRFVNTSATFRRIYSFENKASSQLVSKKFVMRFDAGA